MFAGRETSGAAYTRSATCGSHREDPRIERLQYAASRGIRISPLEVSTSSSGVPGISSPGICTSFTMPTSVGISPGEQGEEETTGVEPEISNTEHPIRSDTKYCPAGSVTRCSKGNNTSSPRNFSASEIEFTPSK